MSSKSFCPRCDAYLAPERRINGYAICYCGWSDSTPSLLAWTEAQQKTIRALITCAILIAGIYAHLASWNQYSLTAPVLLVQKWTGHLSVAGYRELANLCVDLQKWKCAEKTYLALYTQKKEISALAELGELRAQRGEKDRAAKAYRAYFRAGGNEATTSLDFARLLEVKGDEKEALFYYARCVSSSPRKFNTQATAGILRVLLKKGQYAEAYKAVVAFHRKGPAARNFFNEERSRLETLLGPTTTASIISARGPASSTDSPNPRFNGGPNGKKVEKSAHFARPEAARQLARAGHRATTQQIGRR